MKRLHMLVALAMLGAAGGLAQQPAAERPGVTFRSGAREVLLDLVVRDKRGRAVQDLSVDEIRVFEDDAEQQVVSFRAIDAGTARAAPGAVGGAVNPADGGPGPAGGIDPLRLNHLVSIVFHNMTADARPVAYRAAADFLAKNLTNNVYVGLFTIDTDLKTVQPFTNDHEMLERGLETGAKGGFTSFTPQQTTMANNSQAEMPFQTPVDAGPQADSGAPLAGGVARPVQTDVFTDILTRIQSNTSIGMALYDRVDRANKLVVSLRALVDGQSILAGRKTILFFSPGFQLPVDSRWRFEQLISEANKANVSFYTIDAGGLRATAPSLYQSSFLTAGGLPPGLAPGRAGGRLRPEDFTRFETQLESITASPIGNLEELAAETGGRLIANTNNFTKPLQQVMEDVLAYYEIAYRPPPAKADGSYRRIRVELSRPKLDVQSRDGYFDMPEGSGFDLAPHELPLLAALSSDPPPQELPFRSRVLRFPGSSRGSLVVEFAMDGLEFQSPQATEGKVGRFSLLAQLKDAEGRIVRKASQDVPLAIPTENFDAVRRGFFTLSRTWTLTPGRYTLETALHDRVGGHLGTAKSIAVIQRAGDGPALSSVALIRRVDPLPPPVEGEAGLTAQTDAGPDPWVCRAGKIVPTLADEISKQFASNVSHYFVLYPAAKAKAKPELYLQYVKDGEVVGQSQPELPEPEADGSIPYIATAPAASFPEGQYLLNVVLKQGEVGVRERAFFTVTK